MSNIKIKSIELTNFRNIDYAKYELSDVCCFEGKNYIGKTNSILAVLWLLTGKMFDGSSNDDSLKPKTNTKAIVSVEIVFTKNGSEKIVKKEYAENWVKTRGTADLRLEGHTTTYTIDGITQKTNKAALNELNEYLEVNNEIVNKISKLDIKQLLINPLYAAQILEWKDLRDLIFRIIGDVSNDEIIAKEPRIIRAKNVLEKYNYDQNKTIKFLKQEISGINTTIDRLEVIINEYEKCDGPTIQEIQTARIQMAKITDLITDIKNGINRTNPFVTQKEIEISELADRIHEMNIKERELYNNSCISVNANILVLSEKKDMFFSAFNNKKIKLSEIISEIKSKYNEIDSCTRLLNVLSVQKENVKQKYLEEYKKEFNYTGNICPNCGHQLDKDIEDMARAKFETDRKNALNKLNIEGKQAALEIESNQKLIKDNQVLIANLENKKSQLEDEIKNSDIAYQMTCKELDALVSSKPHFKESEELISLRNQLSQMKEELTNMKSKYSDHSDDRLKIVELENEMKPYEVVIGRQQIYLNSQKQKELKLAELKDLNSKRIELEVQKEMVELYMKTKLSLLNNKISNYFGEDIKFILIEENLKEGSYDQTCIPLICGKQTKFKDGSTSEKIITGIKLIECLRKSLGMPNLPILIDECGQLDNNSLALIKDITDSQIIATRVNDSYDTPNLIVL